MLWRRDQQQFLGEHLLAGEPVGQSVRRQPDDRDVDLVALQLGGDVLRAALADANDDAGVRVVEAGQQPWQIHRAGRQHRAEHDGPGVQPGERREVAADRVRAGHDLAGTGEDDGSGLGQFDAAARAPQQHDAELGLQPPDRVRDGRLREMEVLGSARERPGLRDLDKRPQLAELHRRIVVRPDTGAMASIAHRYCVVAAVDLASERPCNPLATPPS